MVVDVRDELFAPCVGAADGLDGLDGLGSRLCSLFVGLDQLELVDCRTLSTAVALE